MCLDNRKHQDQHDPLAITSHTSELDDVDNCNNTFSLDISKEVQKDKLAFVSVFEALHGSDPSLTNSNQGFKGTLDYIFLHSKNHFKVLEAVVVNSLSSLTIESEKEKEKEEKECRSYPNDDWPSDHFMLQTIISLSTTQPL